MALFIFVIWPFLSALLFGVDGPYANYETYRSKEIAEIVAKVRTKAYIADRANASIVYLPKRAGELLSLFNKHEIYVRGVTDRTEQDEILQTISTSNYRGPDVEIKVNFYDSPENKPDTNKNYSIIKPKLLRSITLKLQNRND